ncbi:hypothetical protein BG006_005865 [Podila minutissima]|uniref:F-box domain-containing protein n=1 Tax=Podila minutissima TaxID=64525 RepID=A0A9P5SJF0_9FUNG|nr:hypothetical protein BG006_005865 [Podila minutissima]
MKLLSFRNRISVSPRGTKLSSKPYSGPQSPLDIPEILEKILLLLDERTIRNTTRFVCKLWFVVSRRLALWEVAWDDNRDPFADLESVLRDPLAVALRQLRLYGKSNYIEYLDTILPSLWALTSLSLTFVNKFEINPLLESCPNLQRLRLEGYNHPSELTEIQLSESKGRLLKLAAPTLTGLKLIRLVTRLGPLTLGNTPADTEHTNQLTQFFSSLDTTLLPHLHTLHLSPKTNGLSQRHSCILALIKPGVSRITEWGFCIDDASPFLFARLQTVGNVITTLDLTHGITPTNNDLVRLRLHAFLCNAPSLLHLKAPRVHIAPLDLLLFRESVTAEEPAVDDATTKIWACTRLQTLEIGLYHHLDTASSNDEDEARQARIVFGFLSRVLPQLRVLELNMSSTNLQLNTGFCLLARMARLEQVRVVLMGSVFYWSKKPDLRWMADPRKVGRCMRAKWGWQQGQVTARWKDAVETEVEVVKTRRAHLRVFWNLGDNTTLREDAQWETQGLLTDVKQVLDEIKDGGLKKTGPWPNLCNFRIYVARSVERGMEEMIQAVRPGIDMSSDYEQLAPF